ncbi:RNA methyltransferase [Xanthomonas phaseoli pv. phaseoli]|uniref:site-specific DNA-methyltransferase (adenine-specific) n=2 Tax=Xanthomonas campestris pv. phaseoli TaxID=317013 RepID=A0AB34QGW9_XANCH|nr:MULTISPECIES: Eco57I restriction-modification methylase domain-containing protein [Xanthomonas]ATS24103.1 Eco57I restriction-modification methylase domain-containing protein [Xanthomonas phaseoli pv. phaseoli]ATS28421.1 Eco57I restriction-modification methylase domain-containing protein [Xanthomonas phaseoli pv. phaseoli]ATS32410.1 Eco57I restriction-modification methylase domain-containing protein [Xanthomonas phaseoli pv. phaseoli]ATS36608.1 Eco57I restriction-modification methylase domain
MAAAGDEMMTLDTAANGLALRSEPPPSPAELPSPSQLRAVLRTQSKATAERSQLAFAEAVTAHAVKAYWEQLGSGLAVQPPPHTACDFPEAGRRAAIQFGQAIARLSVEDAASNLGLLYTALLPSEWRSERGVFYTPPALAERLLDQAEAAGLDWSRAHVLDPAAGAGAFLVPAARRLLKSLGDCSPAVAIHNLSARLRGFELDPFAAWMAQVFVEAAALPLIVACGRRPTAVLTVCDSLSITKSKGFDLVVGNPPFGRLKLAAERREYFSRSLYGHANLYGLFMDLAVRLAKPDGLVSFLTPSSFLAGEYFKNLRAVLHKEAPPVSLDFVTARKGVFDDVLQETVLATYRKGAKRARAVVSFIEAQPGVPVKAEPAGHFTLPRKATAPWFLPRHADEAELAKRLRAMSARLADWGYKVSTGPLVWNRFKPQLCDSEEAGTVPLVWAESVTSDGRFVLRAEKRNHKPFLRLQPGDDWLVVRKPCVLLQRTTAKEQARRLIAAEMPASFIKRHAGVTIENHLNMMIPTVENPAVSPALLAAFLNSDAADRAFRCMSGSVAVSAYELENLPLPTASDLKRMVGSKVTRASVEKACAKLYATEGEA